MPRFFKRIKEEVANVMPAVLYFFLAMNLFNCTFGWMMRSEGLKVVSFLHIVIRSLIIAKIMIIADAMPFMNRFSARPLIYNTIWKTSIYSFFGFIFICLERFAPFFFKYGFQPEVFQHIMTGTQWPRFWSMQAWVVVLFLLFVVFRELYIALGPGKMRKMFFGK